MSQQTLFQEPEHGIRKAAYTPPRLTNFGQVRDLTQSGSKSTSELKIGQTCFNWPTTRKSCSERRVKEKIIRVGDHPLGFGLYLFEYRPEFQALWGRSRQFGVMIDEVETVVPEAIFMHADGYKRVDYGVLGIIRPTH